MMEHLKMMISGFYTTVSGQTLRQTDKSDNQEESQTLTSFKWEENMYHLQNICFIVQSHLCSQLCVDCITCWRESQCDVESQCESPSLMSALLACLVTTGTVHWTLSLPLGQAHTGLTRNVMYILEMNILKNMKYPMKATAHFAFPCWLPDMSLLLIIIDVG